MKTRYPFQKVVLIVFVSFIFSCTNSHEDDHKDDNNPPVILIEKPVENATVSAAEVIIKGKVTDESMHEIKIKITRENDGSIWYKRIQDAHDLTSFDLSEMIKSSSDIAFDATLTV